MQRSVLYQTSYRQLAMLSIRNFINLLVVLKVAEGSALQTANRKFVCDESICEFRRIESAFDLSKVIANMVEAADPEQKIKGYLKGFHSEPVEWKNFTEISFKDSRSEGIPTILFEKLSGLTKFAAVGVKIHEINRDDFKFASNLQHLDLSRNEISYLPVRFSPIS